MEGDAYAGRQGSIDIVGRIVDDDVGLHVSRCQTVRPRCVVAAVAKRDVEAERTVRPRALNLIRCGQSDGLDGDRAAHAVRAVRPRERTKSPLAQRCTGQCGERHIIRGRLARCQRQRGRRNGNSHPWRRINRHVIGRSARRDAGDRAPDGLEARQLRNADGRVVKIVCLGGNTDRIQKAAGCLRIGKDSGEGVA